MSQNQNPTRAAQIAADAAEAEAEVLALYEELNAEVAALENRGATPEAIRQYVEAAGANYADWTDWNHDQLDRSYSSARGVWAGAAGWV